MFTQKSFIHLAAIIFVGLFSTGGVTARAASATVVPGRAFVLTPSVAGTAPFTYQWSKDGVALSGATASSYQVSNTQATNAGVYSVRISNSAGSTTSDNATISLASSPAFSTQPASQTVAAGGTVNFTAAANGLPAPTLQWQFNGAVIAGATNSTLTVTNAQSASAGTYSVVATNIAGSATSAGATLTVSAGAVAPAFTTQPLSQTVTAGNAVTFTAVAGGSPAPAYQWRKNGVNLSGATRSSYSIASATSADAGTYTVVASNSAGAVTSAGATLTVTAASVAPVFTTQPVNQTVIVGSTVTLAVAATGTPTPTYQWWYDGAAIAGLTGSSVVITNTQLDHAGTFYVVANNSAGSATSVSATLTVIPAATVPVFTTQPAGQTVNVGNAVTLTAAASGFPSPTYQWRKNSVNISGATGATYAIASVASANAGTYSVVASNSAGSATSSNAVLTVNTVPAITTQPVSQNATAGATVSFTVAASGSPVPVFQWKLNGTNLAGATGATLTLTNVQAANAGTYTAVASNAAGSVTSSGATLTVSPANTAPVFTMQPASQTVTAGSAVAFSAMAGGVPAPTYQWQKNGTNLVGATGASWAIANASSGDAATYVVVATNSVGSVTSSAATLTVNTAPAITTQPASQTVTAGVSVSFTVAASGTPTPTFQWRLNGTAIAGATNAGLSLANVQAANAGTYTVVVTNSAGSVTSTGALLTVNAAATAPVFTTQPVSQTVVAGTAVTFTSLASGSPVPTYQWRKNGVAISGATNASWVVASATSAEAGTYTVVASNSAGSVTSGSAVLTVNTAPVITTQPASQTVTAGTSVTFTVAAGGSPTPTYQWRKNGVAISGATGTAYTKSNTASGDAGTYSVIVTNSVGSATSTGATLTVNPATNAPTITTQPVSQTVAAGGNVTFSVVATGSPSLKYQWKKNGSSIWKATGTSYVLTKVSSSSAGTYTVVVSNSYGSVTSLAAVLSLGTAPAIITQPASRTDTVGATVTFTVVASGSPAPAFQWKLNGSNVAGATGASLTLADIQSADAGTYTVVASNSIGSVTSAGANLTVNAPAISSVVYRVDFNGDGKSDVLWQNGTTGACSVWLMNGAVVGSVTALGSVPANQKVAGTGDFNSDGQADILWQNSVTGECRLWLMAGTNMVSDLSLNASSLDWQMRGTGDFNGDGKSDIVWQNELTGECGVWLMNGTTSTSIVGLGLWSPDVLITGFGDFNQDGQSDILWQNTVTGAYGVRLMSGTTVASDITLGTQTLDWQMSGAGDFNGDTRSDILWQNLLTGECRVWLMKGTTVSSNVALGTVQLDRVLRN